MGDARWVAPRPQTNAAIEALKPTNQPGGYDIPAPVDPNAANVANDGHSMAARYERLLAYQIHQGGGKFGAAQIVVWWGDTIGSNGSGDAISVDPDSGKVTLWDSKAYADRKDAIESDTFRVNGRGNKAVNHARNMIEAFAWKPEDLVAGGLRDKARASLAESTGNYELFTVRYKPVGNNFTPLHLTQTKTITPLP